MNDNTRRLIILEAQSAFSNDKLNQMIDLYEDFLNLDTAVEKGVRGDWLSNVSAFYELGQGSMQSSHRYLLNSESVFKKILYIVNEQKYTEIVSEKKLGMYGTFENIGLLKCMPNNINLSNYDYKKLEDPVQKAIVRTYQLRNIASHTSEEWSLSDMIESVREILISTVYAVWINRGSIMKVLDKSTGISQYNIDKYINNIAKEYNAKLKKGFRYALDILRH